MPLLEVERLTVSYRLRTGWQAALRDYSLQLQAGEIVGIVGESGSGKSTAALALMRYLGSAGRIEPGARMHFDGQDLLQQSPAQLRRLWMRQIKLVPQNAGAALNPSLKVGAQIMEALPAAPGQKNQESLLELLAAVNLPEPAQVAQRYPHELSGGMQQRVTIAMALAGAPQLLILDEPTTGLDITTEAQILDLLRELIAERDMSLLYITHNLGVVAQLCQRVQVLYAGEIMEEAAVADLFAQPRHPYTRGLIDSLPHIGQNKHKAVLRAIGGNPPTLSERQAGCVFVQRCAWALERCHHEHPTLERLPDGRMARCHRWHELDLRQPSLAPAAPHQQGRAGRTPPSMGQAGSEQEKAHKNTPSEPVLQVRELRKYFPLGSSLRELWRRQPPQPLRALDGIDLQLPAGQTLGLVGESGSGKTTLARIVIGLQARNDGDIELLGADLQGSARQRPRQLLAKLQMVFQNPQNSLNPYHTVRQTLQRPLLKLRGLSPAAADAAMHELLRAVNLRPEYAERYPDALSGGEKQRVAIARAFAAEPALLLCDEPVSALDSSVQAALLNLLADLQAEQGCAYLFISHDLAVVGYLSDRIAVIYRGLLWEIGSTQQVFAAPYHPYTEALLSAIPIADPQQRSQRIPLRDSRDSPRELPAGCRFHPRCPRKIGAICEQEKPPWRQPAAGHRIRCHIPPDELAQAQQTLALPPAGDARPC